MDNSKVKQFFDFKSAHWDERPTRPSEVYDNFAKEYFRINKGDKVLDLGCGSGTFIPAIYKLNHASVTGMDISDKMIDLAKPKFAGNDDVTLMAGDFYDSDIKGFDVIVCHNAISHFLDSKELSKKCAAALNPGGRLVITHFVNFEEINKRHSHANPMVARILESAPIEAKYFEDEFDIHMTMDDPYYIISLTKKN